MSKVKGKGTVLQQTISAAFVSVAAITDVDLSGEASQDWESTTLDGGVFQTKDLSGYSASGTVKAGLFFDPALAGHQAIVAVIATPLAAAWKILYSNPSLISPFDPSAIEYTAAGTGFDEKVVMNDGLKATLTLNRTGAPIRTDPTP